MPSPKTPQIGALAGAVCAVMAAVSTVPKTGRNTHFNYDYVTAADVFDACRAAMQAHGLALIPTGSTFAQTCCIKGNPQQGGRWRTDLLLTYTLMHVGGESVAIQVASSGVDTEDKGPYKAVTGGLKYALIQLFLIPTGTDPEASAQTASRGGGYHPPQQTPQQQRNQQDRQELSAENQREARQRQRIPEIPEDVRAQANGNGSCPACGSDLWDNTEQRNQGGKRPAWKCRNNACTGGKPYNNKPQPWIQWDSEPTPGAGAEQPAQQQPPPQDPGPSRSYRDTSNPFATGQDARDPDIPF